MAHRALPLLVAASSLAVAGNTWAAASQWKLPCPVVHGTADTSTHPQAGLRLARLLRHEDSAYLPITDGRHDPLHDDDAARVLHHVLAFVNGCLGM